MKNRQNNIFKFLGNKKKSAKSKYYKPHPFHMHQIKVSIAAAHMHIPWYSFQKENPRPRQVASKNDPCEVYFVYTNVNKTMAIKYKCPET